jgi:hypothetical protein
LAEQGRAWSYISSLQPRRYDAYRMTLGKTPLPADLSSLPPDHTSNTRRRNTMAPPAAGRTPQAPGAPLLVACTAALAGAYWLGTSPLQLRTAGVLVAASRVLPLLTRPVLAPTSAVLLLHAGIKALGYAVPPLAVVLPACLFFLVARLDLPQPPGRTVTTLILTPGAPFTVGPFSWLAGLRAHFGWQRHVLQRTKLGKTAEIFEDTDFHWGLDKENGRRKQPENGELVRSWDRIVVWDDDCPPLDVLEECVVQNLAYTASLLTCARTGGARWPTSQLTQQSARCRRMQ